MNLLWSLTVSDPFNTKQKHYFAGVQPVSHMNEVIQKWLLIVQIWIYLFTFILSSTTYIFPQITLKVDEDKVNGKHIVAEVKYMLMTD